MENCDISNCAENLEKLYYGAIWNYVHLHHSVSSFDVLPLLPHLEKHGIIEVNERELIEAQPMSVDKLMV